jgi:protein-S-isoprenylcysteine O-methyltransferase Ste14
MDDNNKKEELVDTRMIHFSLSLSYLMFLFAVVLGVVFDLIIPINILSGFAWQYTGLFLIILGSLFAYWAQSTSRRPRNYEVRERILSDFERGPYKYMRTPTHFGLFIMTLGLALVINSPFSILFTLIGHMLSKLMFLKKEEILLEKKYGQVFVDYKKKVKNWI